MSRVLKKGPFGNDQRNTPIPSPKIFNPFSNIKREPSRNVTWGTSNPYTGKTWKFPKSLPKSFLATSKKEFLNPAYKEL